MLSISANEPVTYLVFPALIWAALRFGPPGATLSVTLAAGAAIAFTANELGPFFRQPIDDKALSTQLYIAVAALTTLFVGALVGERQRSVTELKEAKQREGDRAVAERHRIARELHDSVSQALFSTVLHTRTAERDLEKEGLDPQGPVARSLDAIAELTAGAQREMRVLLFELNGTAGDEGLVAGLARHASTVGTPEGLTRRRTRPRAAPAARPGNGGPTARHRPGGDRQRGQALGRPKGVGACGRARRVRLDGDRGQRHRVRRAASITPGTTASSRCAPAPRRRAPR